MPENNGYERKPVRRDIVAYMRELRDESQKAAERKVAEFHAAQRVFLELDAAIRAEEARQIAMTATPRISIRPSYRRSHTAVA